jgi:hypothetical protein
VHSIDEPKDWHPISDTGKQRVGHESEPMKQKMIPGEIFVLKTLVGFTADAAIVAGAKIARLNFER